MIRFEGQKKTNAFVLHLRPFQESSAIIQFFTPQYGRISAVVKGIQRKNSQARKAILQPFKPLLISLVGNTDLKTLVDCELDTQSKMATDLYLTGDNLACGFYLNELLIRALPELQEFPELFEHYLEAVVALVEKSCFHSTLRIFEVRLLTELGIAPDWKVDLQQKPIQPDLYYQFIADEGFQIAEPQPGYLTGHSPRYKGQSIISLGGQVDEQRPDKESQHLTQRLLRQVIGDKPLQSRKLWQHSRKSRKID